MIYGHFSSPLPRLIDTDCRFTSTGYYFTEGVHFKDFKERYFDLRVTCNRTKQLNVNTNIIFKIIAYCFSNASSKDSQCFDLYFVYYVDYSHLF